MTTNPCDPREQQARLNRLEDLYMADGRDNCAHPQHGLYSGLLFMENWRQNCLATSLLRNKSNNQQPLFVAHEKNPPSEFVDVFRRCWWGRVINNRWDWHFDNMPITGEYCWCLPHDVDYLPAMLTAGLPSSAPEHPAGA